MAAWVSWPRRVLPSCRLGFLWPPGFPGPVGFCLRAAWVSYGRLGFLAPSGFAFVPPGFPMAAWVAWPRRVLPSCHLGFLWPLGLPGPVGFCLRATWVSYGRLGCLAPSGFAFVPLGFPMAAWVAWPRRV